MGKSADTSKRGKRVGGWRAIDLKDLFVAAIAAVIVGGLVYIVGMGIFEALMWLEQ